MFYNVPAGAMAAIYRATTYSSKDLLKRVQTWRPFSESETAGRLGRIGDVEVSLPLTCPLSKQILLFSP